jgi:N-acetylmuramoyl-L-alanine amidase
MLSPNFGDRRGGVLPDLIVIHYTGMTSCDTAMMRLCDPTAEVSAHYLISEQGAVHDLVPEAARAWHAGAGEWARVTDVNSRSIGIELANPGDAPFAAAQMTALEDILMGVMARWSIPPHRVIGHSDMAPLRKSDPGLRFDWRRLARAGLSVWPGTIELGHPHDFIAAACRFGYPWVDDAALLRAFRMRFRPWATGPCDGVDAGMAIDLARRFAVDAIGAGA